MESPSYEDVCRYIGHLYIESRKTIEELTRKIAQLQGERDDALKLIGKDVGRS